jgi:uncharacterized membrane protein SpoIIM required for sporulation
MKPKKFSISKIYSESWEYIKFCRNKIYFMIGIFFAFAMIGYFIPVSQSIVEMILDYIQKILEQTKNLSGLQLIFFIFLNNVQASFLALAFGIFLGIFPVMFAIANGYVLGFVASFTVKQSGILSLWSLLPHGIFELFAVFISLGLGLNWGTFIFQKNKKKFFKENIFISAKVFLFVVIPLLIIAAIIEGSLIYLIR